ncbi:tRNA uridine-5-carboxymethylaminomethyl(34) synthesis GTPase MnmE [Roseivivax sediminis]|uniref:tRNA modification GTPase MnmE n=1 Tax=Roseivivax sediminis TaxID=936889 RepID=A0A1I1TY65_9RHOB|nr:tRNA uridine-5-carboxymethylaminomethyl(34) synthesis GTPase MnmE [Roseivivax sediminis]SFD63542.1 tRNA modification GTPase trmE [Roseivivax sediminis]
MDTIFALASAPGKAGVAVVRISGPAAWSAGRALAGTLPAPRQAGLRRLHDHGGGFLDEALVLAFEAGRSFTGEESVELHLHGSAAIVQAVLKELAAESGLRPAEPGEFTRRAMENGRLDLAQVEALADLIEAETEAQRQQALRVFAGALGDKVARWRADLVRAASLLEAVMDFADEEVPTDVSPEVIELIDRVQHALETEVRGFESAERVRSGFEIAIVGAPNVGKSTLLNTLAGRDAAITSEVAGTTRDVIEVRIDLGGLAVTILDTAGLRETEDRVEALGVARARDRAERADLRVFLSEQDEAPDDIAARPGDLSYRTKADLTGDGKGISARTGQGIERVVSDIRAALVDRAAGAGLVTRERHRLAMTHGIERLRAAADVVRQGPEMYDIGAEELRSAIRRLDSVIGRVDVDSVLDEIFSSFCLGK